MAEQALEVARSAVLPAIVALPFVSGHVFFHHGHKMTEGRMALRLAPTGAALFLLAWHGVALHKAAGARAALVWHLQPAVRVGSLQLGLDLALDGVGCVVALVLCAIALAVEATTAQSSSPKARLTSALVSVTAGFALLSSLAASAHLLLLGSVGASLAAAALVTVSAADRRAPTRSLVARAVGDLSLVGALSLGFWSLGGAFLSVGYTPDTRPRLEVVSGVAKSAKADDDARLGRLMGEASPQSEQERRDRERLKEVYDPSVQGSLSMSSWPGARVYLDGSSTPLATSPFSAVAVRAGIHSVRVEAGAGVDEHEVKSFRVGPAEQVTIVAAGPTTSFVDLALSAPSGPLSARLSASPWLSFSIAALLWLWGATRLLQAPFVGARAEAWGALSVASCAAVVLLPAAPALLWCSRLAATFAPHGTTGQLALGALGVGGALAAGALSLGATGPSPRLSWAFAAQAGLCLALAAAGGAQAAIVHGCVAALGVCIAMLTTDGAAARASAPWWAPRAAFVAAACVGALPPLGGLTLVEALRAATALEGARAAQALVLVASIVAAVAAARAAFDAPAQASRGEGDVPGAHGWAVAGLVAAALALSLSTASTFADVPLARLLSSSMLPASSPATDRATALVLVGISAVAAIAALRARHLPGVRGLALDASSGLVAALDAVGAALLAAERPLIEPSPVHHDAHVDGPSSPPSQAEEPGRQQAGDEQAGHDQAGEEGAGRSSDPGQQQGEP